MTRMVLSTVKTLAAVITAVSAAARHRSLPCVNCWEVRWLVLDRNGNGTIDSGEELFGNATPPALPPPGESKHGFLALAEYDFLAKGGNGDGLITASDAIFSSLQLWHDRNHNGISEPSELRNLSGSGIATIECKYRESKRTDEYGNKFRYRAKVKDERGEPVGRWAWDVFLKMLPK